MLNKSLASQTQGRYSRYQFNVSDLDHDPEWDAFINRSRGGSFFQTCSFSRAFREINWDVKRITLIEAGKIVAGVQILLRNTQTQKYIGRIIYGPVFADPEDKSVVDQMLSFLVEFLKNNRIIFLFMQPGILNKAVELKIKSLGMYAGRDFIDPSNEVLIDLHDDIEAVFSRIKHDKRRDIRRSQKRAVTFRVGGIQDITEFYRLHKSSSQRGGYNPYNLAFYNTLWEGFSQKDEIHLFFSDHENRPLAGLISITNKDTLYAYKIGWSGERSDLYPNDALYWGAIQWAKQNHYQYFSMSGIDEASAMAYIAGNAIPEKQLNTYTRFKLQFGGDIILYTPTHYYSYNPMIKWLSQRYFDTPIVAKSINMLIEFVKMFRSKR